MANMAETTKRSRTELEDSNDAVIIYSRTKLQKTTDHYDINIPDYSDDEDEEEKKQRNGIEKDHEKAKYSSTEKEDVDEVDMEIDAELSLRDSREEIRESKEITPKVMVPIEPRNYQRELASVAIEGSNSIICAPTGSGKTLTAGFVCQEIMRRMKETANGLQPPPFPPPTGRIFKAVFVVCLRNLVLQQRDALARHIPKVGSLGETQTLDEAIDEFDIVVLTSQVFVNAMKNKQVPLNRFHLIIMDECHHTNGSHPYNQLMDIYHQAKWEKPEERLPQILGLTASLGVGSAATDNEEGEQKAKDHNARLCANLDCEFISYVKDPENMKELLKSSPKPTEDQIKEVDKRPDDNRFYGIMKQLMEKIEGGYLQDTPPYKRGSQQYENWIETRRGEAEKTMTRTEEMVACEALLKLNSAWIFQDQLRARDSKKLLDRYFMQELKLRVRDVEKTMCRWYDEVSDDLERVVRGEQLEDWPMLKQLHALLKELMEKDFDARGIVMARTIAEVDALVQFLEENSPDPLLTAAKFVGHRSGVESSMTEKQQEEVLKKFRKGKVNLLVATDVAQEGLDIPTCNFVIRYDFVSNEIGSVQAKGRARAPASKCYLIVTKGSINRGRELLNLEKEHLMQKVLQDIVGNPESALEFEKMIKRHQKDNREKFVETQRKMETEISKESTCGYYIYCKCKAFLCSANFLIKYGCHYICIDEAFPRKVTVNALEKPKEFRDDTVHGSTVCNECKGTIGAKMTYKRGRYSSGYSLAQKSIMWTRQDEADNFNPVRKWTCVPFQIKEELY